MHLEEQLLAGGALVPVEVTGKEGLLQFCDHLQVDAELPDALFDLQSSHLVELILAQLVDYVGCVVVFAITEPDHVWGNGLGQVTHLLILRLRRYLGQLGCFCLMGAVSGGVPENDIVDHILQPFVRNVLRLLAGFDHEILQLLLVRHLRPRFGDELVEHVNVIHNVLDLRPASWLYPLAALGRLSCRSCLDGFS